MQVPICLSVILETFSLLFYCEFLATTSAVFSCKFNRIFSVYIICESRKGS